jgi:hypothetical protein
MAIYWNYGQMNIFGDSCRGYQKIFRKNSENILQSLTISATSTLNLL